MPPIPPSSSRPARPAGATRPASAREPAAAHAAASRVVFRADDAAASAAVNAGIVEACTLGPVRNVSVMAVGPALGEVAGLLGPLRHAPAGRAVLLGLHLCFNAEWDAPRWAPVLPPERVPALLDADGRSFTRDPRDLLGRDGLLPQLVAEARAQLDRLRAAGVRVGYVDEHMGVGWLPGARDAFRRIAEEDKLLYGDGVIASVAQLAPVGEAATAGDPRSRLEETLARLVAAPAADRLWITHPLRMDAASRSVGSALYPAPSVAEERDAERAWLVGANVGERLRAAGLRSVTYAELDA